MPASSMDDDLMSLDTISKTHAFHHAHFSTNEPEIVVNKIPSRGGSITRK